MIANIKDLLKPRTTESCRSRDSCELQICSKLRLSHQTLYFVLYQTMLFG